MTTGNPASSIPPAPKSGGESLWRHRARLALAGIIMLQAGYVCWAISPFGPWEPKNTNGDMFHFLPWFVAALHLPPYISLCAAIGAIWILFKKKKAARTFVLVSLFLIQLIVMVVTLFMTAGENAPFKLSNQGRMFVR